MRSRLTNPLKYHGWKFYLAKKVIQSFPAHQNYVEPFAGGLSVLLSKRTQEINEVVNDVDKNLSNFWSVLQGVDSFGSLIRLCQSTPFSEIEWDNADIHHFIFPGADDYVSAREVRAWQFFVWCRQSLAGRMDCFSSITKSRTRRGMNEQVSGWLSAIDGLPEVHERLKRVLILNRDYNQVIQLMDNKKTLFYLDPPYPPSTRVSQEVYAHDMSEEQHMELLDLICHCEAKICISSYANHLYDGKLSGWNRKDFDIANHAAGGSTKRRMTESIYMNY